MPIFNKLKNVTDSFFDSLKINAINQALKSAKKNEEPPLPIIQELKALEEEAKLIDDILREYDPDYDSSEEKKE
jgi:hypothetical protein